MSFAAAATNVDSRANLCCCRIEFVATRNRFVRERERNRIMTSDVIHVFTMGILLARLDIFNWRFMARNGERERNQMRFTNTIMAYNKALFFVVEELNSINCVNVRY